MYQFRNIFIFNGELAIIASRFQKHKVRMFAYCIMNFKYMEREKNIIKTSYVREGNWSPSYNGLV